MAILVTLSGRRETKGKLGTDSSQFCLPSPPNHSIFTLQEVADRIDGLYIVIIEAST